MDQLQSGEIDMPLPLHRQVAMRIQEEIARQGLGAHSKIPAEPALAQQYGVSRGTVIKALEALVQQGILYRRRPRGTFVAPAPEPATTAGAPPASMTRPVVGLIIPHQLDAFIGGIVHGVESALRTAGYGLIFAYSENDPELERYHIEQCIGSGAAGLILFPADPPVERRGESLVSVSDEERVALLRDLGRRIPFVLVDRYLPGVVCDYVVSDDAAAGAAAALHLLELGHQRIGFVTGRPQVTSSAARYSGYEHVLRAHRLGVDEDLVLLLHTVHETNPVSVPAGLPASDVEADDRAALRDYLLRPNRPTAIIAIHDLVALRLLQIAEEVGVEAPDHVAIVSCGGNDMGAHARVPLTAIVQPAVELGRRAALTVLDRITGRSSRTRRIVLPVSLVVRKSCGGPQRTGLGVPLHYAYPAQPVASASPTWTVSARRPSGRMEAPPTRS